MRLKRHIVSHIYEQYKELLELCGKQYIHFDDCLDKTGEGRLLIANWMNAGSENEGEKSGEKRL